MPSRPLLTTVGSFPRMSDAPEEAIVKAVEFQRAHGVEIVTDGEQRSDMLSLYETLPGVRVDKGIPRFVGRVRPPEYPAEFVKIRDLEFLQKRFPDLHFRVNLTGPSTFAFACASSGAGPSYRSAMDPTLHEDVAEAIRALAHEVGRRGVDLQLDDPILSQGMRDFNPALERIDRIASEIPRSQMSLHVCGGLGRSKVLDALYRLENVSTLNLALAGRQERGNLDLLDRRSLEDRDLFLGAGCVDVQVSRAEELTAAADVAALLGTVSERLGNDRIRYVLPDCGLRATAPELVSPLLTSLRKAFERVYLSGA